MNLYRKENIRRLKGSACLPSPSPSLTDVGIGCGAEVRSGEGIIVGGIVVVDVPDNDDDDGSVLDVPCSVCVCVVDTGRNDAEDDEDDDDTVPLMITSMCTSECTTVSIYLFVILRLISFGALLLSS